MGTTAQKLQAILDSKAAIKTAIENKGVEVGDVALDEYADKISSIVGEDPDGMNGFLSVESKTIPTSASATTNITYNKNCGILDENYKKWDTLAWHQRWVDNGYSATGLSKPIGIWMKAFGLDIVYLWPVILDVGYSDVTGTSVPSTETFQFFSPVMAAIITATAADRTVWPANQSDMIAHGTAGKYKSATWRSANNGDGLDMVCDNTMETFTIPSRDVGNATVFMKDNVSDYMESYYQQNEFLRALFAICSGISTTQPNGTKTTVEILNANGQQAAVGEDMYFWIGGTNTGLLAKYNLNCIPSMTSNVTTGSTTQTIVDNIYAKQKQNGVNMNDTGVNSASLPTMIDGMKGAEAIAVGGYWYIKTPNIATPNGTTFNGNNNMIDAPIVYYCRYHNLTLMTERELFPYWLNKATHITGLTNLLRTTEGITSVPAMRPATANMVGAIRQASNYSWYVGYASGSIGNGLTYQRQRFFPTLPANTQYT